MKPSSSNWTWQVRMRDAPRQRVWTHRPSRHEPTCSQYLWTLVVAVCHPNGLSPGRQILLLGINDVHPVAAITLCYSHSDKTRGTVVSLHWKPFYEGMGGSMTAKLLVLEEFVDVVRSCEKADESESGVRPTNLHNNISTGLSTQLRLDPRQHLVGPCWADQGGNIELGEKAKRVKEWHRATKPRPISDATRNTTNKRPLPRNTLSLIFAPITSLLVQEGARLRHLITMHRHPRLVGIRVTLAARARHGLERLRGTLHLKPR